MSKFNVGDKVKYIGKDHRDYPKYYPTIGTIGKIIGALDDDPDCYIQWTKNSTSGNDEHWCSKDDIELVEDTDMTNEEIWEMLRPKVEKNGLISKANLINVSADNYPNNEVKITKTYLEDDVHNAIALEYKVGYLRAMKGRPFKIGEKKKKGGHWEPIDPNNLPKEGTRVRYARKCVDYGDDIIKLGDTGVIEREEKYNPAWFGMRLDNPKGWIKWICFDDAEDCLDMWVEDDE